ncbi:hypothetical protein Tco_0258510 [Tanacetum coccineum]
MPYKGSFNDRKSKIQNQQVRQNENTSSPKVTKSSSGSRSRNDSDEGSVNYDNHQEDRYSRTHEDQGPSPRKSSKKKSEPRFKRGDSRYDETDYDDDDQGSSSSEISSRQKSNSKAQLTSVKKKSSTHRSSRSHLNDNRGEHDELTSNTKKVGRKTVVDQEPVVRKTKTSSFGGARRDDESESDDDYDGPVGLW